MCACHLCTCACASLQLTNSCVPTRGPCVSCGFKPCMLPWAIGSVYRVFVCVCVGVRVIRNQWGHIWFCLAAGLRPQTAGDGQSCALQFKGVPMEHLGCPDRAPTHGPGGSEVEGWDGPFLFRRASLRSCFVALFRWYMYCTWTLRESITFTHIPQYTRPNTSHHMF